MFKHLTYFIATTAICVYGQPSVVQFTTFHKTTLYINTYFSYETDDYLTMNDVTISCLSLYTLSIDHNSM